MLSISITRKPRDVVRVAEPTQERRQDPVGPKRSASRSSGMFLVTGRGSIASTSSSSSSKTAQHSPSDQSREM
jgi:hypothetical protein